MAFGPGFTRRDLPCVRGLPGRRWDPGLGAWRVPGVDTPLEALVANFGEALVLRGYSPRTRRAYLDQARRFLAFTGVAIGLLVGGGYNSFMALLGILSLVGIVVNNAIVMLEQIDVERQAGLDHYQAIVKGCLARLRPILMTALTTILGMMPIILSRDPLFYDMAITIAFGLAFATVLTLGLAPVLYSAIMRVPSPRR